MPLAQDICQTGFLCAWPVGVEFSIGLAVQFSCRFCFVNYLQLLDQAVVDIIKQTIVVIEPVAHKRVCKQFLWFLHLVMT